MKRIAIPVAIAVLFAPFVLIAVLNAQNPPPTIDHLSPEASKWWLTWDAAKKQKLDECGKTFNDLADKQNALLLGAGIAREKWEHCTADSQGVVSCYPPPKASPSQRDE